MNKIDKNHLTAILEKTSWFTNSHLMPTIPELIQAILNPDSVKKGSDRTVFIRDHFVLKWSIPDGRTVHKQNQEEIHSYFRHYLASKSPRIALAEIYGYSKGASHKGGPEILEHEFLVMERLKPSGASSGVAPWPYTLIDGGQVGLDSKNVTKCFDYGNLLNLIRNPSYRAIFGIF